jgi:16S rRNA (cytidine1402-2'-O)-methyltransferase
MTGSLAESPTGQPRRGALYVVSTPIGNLDDITVRALNTLKSVGLVAAEDTRRTGLLLRHFGIGTPVTSLHEHNEQQKIPALLHKLAEGTDVALVSDAGTPLVADPGQRLIASVVAQRLRVIPVPGASAVLAAIVASGYPATEFVFAGFAPARSKDRIDWLKRLADDERTIVFFEAPHRIEKTVAVMAELLGNRPIVLARELTKLHEEITHTTAQGLIGTRITQRGEFTVVLGPYSKPKDRIMSVDDVELNLYFCQLTDSTHISRRDAVAATAVHFGLSPNDVYERLERIKRSGPP